MASKKTTEVFNIHRLPKKLSDPLYIGRPSYWQNPFVIGKDGDREEVLRKYKRHLWARKDLLRKLPELRGKQLLCFCAPERCHGHVLVAALAWLDGLPAQEKAAVLKHPSVASIAATMAKKPVEARTVPSAAAIDAMRAKRIAARQIAPSADQAEDLLIAAGLSS